ncbi:hypothetical protein GCM10010216_62950 [Streptomyces flaveolus]|nr:hypothetical protein GCM10010216_62950 [Streptomyces flaveolus]
MGLSTRDRCLAVVPMFHVNAWSLPFASMLSGASLLMPDRFLQPEPLLAMMKAERPTHAAAVPTIWTGLAARLAAHPQDITHLREVFVGGSAMPPTLMKTFEEEHRIKVVHAWGMTETSSVGTVARPPADATGEDLWRYRMSQGRFAPLVEFRLKGDDDAPVPHDGESLGELEVKGPWITGSYYSPSDEPVEAESFDDGWLRTGDVGRISPDGFLTLVDRAKDVIKSGGEWISSIDMENDIMAHPSVAEAAVFGIPDERWDERPCAAVVLRKGESADTAALREHLAGNWAKWQLPERWAVVAEIPRTSVGKIDKKVLRRQYADGRLSFVQLDQGGIHTAVTLLTAAFPEPLQCPETPRRQTVLRSLSSRKALSIAQAVAVSRRARSLSPFVSICSERPSTMDIPTLITECSSSSGSDVSALRRSASDDLKKPS